MHSVADRQTDDRMVPVAANSRAYHHHFVVLNLLGGITLLPISVPKAVQVSSRLRGCEECGCTAASAVIAAYRLMTILRRPLSLAHSAEVDCNTVMQLNKLG